MAFQITQTGQELQYLADEAEKIAAEYDETASWVTDDYCTHEGTIYRCTASTTGTFDASAWTAVILCDELEGLRTRMSTAEGDISSLNTSLAQTSGTMTAYNGFSFDRYECYKVLGWVIINAQLHNGSTATSGATVIASVPSDFAPSTQYTGLLQLNTTVGVFAITTQGSITCYSSIAANQVNVSIHVVYKAA